MSTTPDAPGPTVDARLRQAFDALRGQRWAEALEGLEGLVAPDRPGAEARAWSFRAQALEGLGRLAEAERAAAEAVRHARRAEDAGGVAATRALHARILQAVAAAATLAQARAADRALVDEPDEVLVARCVDETSRAAVLIRKANTLADAGAFDPARSTIHRAMYHARLAGSPREQVLAHLCLARLDPASAEAEVRAAHALADTSGDHNLLTAVARAGAMVGVRFGRSAVEEP